MDLDSLTASWRQRLEAERQARLERAEAAREAAVSVAALLRREFGAREVWLFGSLLSEPRHDGFDIDLAVRGLTPDRYYTALARISELAAEPVDLVTLETCSDRVRQRVAASARRLDDGE